MTTILIPTDFNEKSVHRSQDILKNFKAEQVKLIFFHAYTLTDSITDLLMLNRRTAEYGLIPEAFHKACYELRQQNETIAAIGIEYYYGNTIASFRNFAEAQEVDAIFYPSDYQFNKISRYSLDPAVLLSKSGLPVIVPVKTPAAVIEKIIIPQIQEPVTEMA